MEFVKKYKCLFVIISAEGEISDSQVGGRNKGMGDDR